MNEKIAFSFNGITKDFLEIDDSEARSGSGPIEHNTMTVGGMDGAYITETQIGIREIVIPINVFYEDIEELQKLKEEISSWLYYKEDKELIFSDEPDRVYFARLDGVAVYEEHAKFAKTALTFICVKPFKFGQEKEIVATTDTISARNEGTYSAKPVFELTATKKSTFAMVTKNDSDYNIIGTLTDVDVKTVNEKTVQLDEVGDTLTTWKKEPTGTGSFKKGNAGIVVSSYGTGASWHGPKVTKEITPLQDFELEFFVNVRTERPEQVFRISTNFYDENMNELGMLRLWNNKSNQTAQVVEARIGKYIDRYVNYLISRRNFDWVGQRVFGGVLRVTRKGNKFTFYASHITQTGRHSHAITETYIDKENAYSGKLKFITIDASVYGDKAVPNELGINRVRVSKLNKIEVDETPYIVNAGDVVIFDHVNDDILINGESRNDLKNFGGTFFELDKGNNTILITPENSFTSKIRYNERYI